MTILHSISSSSLPHWDGSRILFEITDGDEHIPCAISRGALEEIGETRCFRTAELLGCFASARGRIEGLALAKLRARPNGVTGRLSLWAGDVDDLPTGGAGAAAYLKTTRHQSA